MFFKKFFLGFSLFCFSTSSVAAKPDSAEKYLPKGPKVVRVNPQSLQKIMLTQSNTLFQGLNKVYQAKVNVDLARANLLPSLNLGVPITGEAFLVSTVIFLLPFLVPTKWIDVRVNQRLLNAEVKSFYILQLNQYASIYSLYATLVGDMALRDTLLEQYENLLLVQKSVESGIQSGLRSEADLHYVSAQAHLIKTQAERVNALIVMEVAAIRSMLALPLDTRLEIDSTHPMEVEKFENEDPRNLLKVALARTPELEQVDELILAAKTERWSRIFSFFVGASAVAKVAPAENATFGYAQSQAGFSFGFGYFPSITLSNLDIQKMQLRRAEVVLEQTRLLEASLNSIASMKLQLASAQASEEQLRQAYKAYLNQYDLGTVDLVNVLTAANLLAQASAMRINAQIGLDAQRIALNRIFIHEDFNKIKECKVQQLNAGGLVKRVFQPNTLTPLEDLCKPKSEQKNRNPKKDDIPKKSSPTPSYGDVYGGA